MGYVQKAREWESKQVSPPVDRADTLSVMFQKCCSAFDKELAGQNGFGQWLQEQPDLAAQIETGEATLDKLRATGDQCQPD